MLGSNWLKKMGEDELREVAFGIKEGKVFTSKHFKSLEKSKSLTPQVFVPIGAGALSKASKEELDSLGMVYEWKEWATAQEVCGYPVFYSAKYLTTEDTSKIAEILERLNESDSGTGILLQ